MYFKRIYDSDLAQASYLVGCQKNGTAIVIDPARNAQQYVTLAQQEGLKITHVTETHIHADYLSGARELAEQTGAALPRVAPTGATPLTTKPCTTATLLC